MRKYYLDNIRWMTVVIVVIYHVFYMYNAEGIAGVVGRITDPGVKQYWDVYQYAVYPWFMFLLFIVSGISARYYLENHTAKEFLKTRTTKLLVPSTIGLFVFDFVQGYYNMELANAFSEMQSTPKLLLYLIMCVSGTGVLWYIQVLWVYSLVLIPIRKLDKNRFWNICSRTGIVVIIALAAVAWLSAQILNTPMIVVYRFGYYAMAFFSGYFVFSHDEVIEVLKKYFVLLLAAALAVGVAFCAVNFGNGYADAPVNRSVLFTTFGWFASMAVIGGAAKYADFRNDFTAWMSRRSWGLYIFHYLGISIVAYYIGRHHILNAFVVYILTLVGGFAAGYILGFIMERIPFFRWAVLGISRKKRCEDVQG